MGKRGIGAAAPAAPLGRLPRAYFWQDEAGRLRASEPDQVGAQCR